jgi:hypothetical protein
MQHSDEKLKQRSVLSGPEWEAVLTRQSETASKSAKALAKF